MKSKFWSFSYKKYEDWKVNRSNSKKLILKNKDYYTSLIGVLAHVNFTIDNLHEVLKYETKDTINKIIGNVIEMWEGAKISD